MADSIWNVFNKDSVEIKGNERRVQCILCENKVKYTVISDLKRHLYWEHSNYIDAQELKTLKNTKPHNEVSPLWNHFTPTECKFFAECNHCRKVLSYRTTVGNLNKHLKRVHPAIDWRSEVPGAKTNASSSNSEAIDFTSEVSGADTNASSSKYSEAIDLRSEVNGSETNANASKYSDSEDVQSQTTVYIVQSDGDQNKFQWNNQRTD